jgi:adenylate kinase family enzyme
MKIEIESNILRYYLRNVYFINGTAYAGKSTMVAMLAEKYGMVHCGENYHAKNCDKFVTPEYQPNIGYFQTMKDWQEFINRTPDEYARWIDGSSREAAQIEIAELLRIPEGQKVIVDTNIPLDVLREISDYHHVAIMLSPQSMSVDRFFDRDDAEKQFLLEQIKLSENPEKTMTNFKECLARINSKECYDEFLNSGFFTIIRDDTTIDTRLDTMSKLAEHFLLE